MLKQLWAGWKRVAFAIGLVQSKILLTILYVVVIAPFALAVRLFGDPLRIGRCDPATFYLPTEPHAGGLEAAKRQF
jgi:hypothetical protein